MFGCTCAAQHNDDDMSNKRNFYVANATNAVIMVKASDDETIVRDVKARNFYVDGEAGVKALVPAGVGGKVGVDIGFERQAQTFKETLFTKTGFAPLESQKAISFEKGAYLTYATGDFGTVYGPVATPTKCQAFIITEGGLLKSKVLPSKPTLKQAFTEELSEECYLKTPKKRILESDGFNEMCSATVVQDENGEGNPYDFEEYNLYDD